MTSQPIIIVQKEEEEEVYCNAAAKSWITCKHNADNEYMQIITHLGYKY